MKNLDVGTYHENAELFEKLMKDLYSKYPNGVTLPPEYAEQFENNMLRILIRFARYKFVARLVKKTDEVLEVGCGAGLGSIFVSQHCKHVTGIDVNSTEIEEAKKINRRKNVSLKVADLFELKENKQFDVIYAVDVIEHMTEETAHKLLASMTRHLRPSGMLIIGTPSIYSYEYQGSLSKASHIKCYDQNELVSLIEHYCGRTLAFSMNDEVVHTGHPKMAWFYFVVGLLPKNKAGVLK